jgi:hypothetical protein
MNRSGFSRIRGLRIILIGVLAVYGGSCGPSYHAQTVPPGTTLGKTIAPLSVDDVSLLFPAPTRAQDLANLIAVSDLSTPDPRDSTKRDPVWTDGIFQQFLAIATGPQAQVDGTSSRIVLPPEVQSKTVWFVAGIRIDAGAPGLSTNIGKQFGQSPEIRLIIQPVTANSNPNGAPVVHDIAGHLIFDFSTRSAPAQPGCSPRFVPNSSALNAIVADIAALRTKLAAGELGSTKITTDGLPLGVHPGLANSATANALRQEIVAFLERHISSASLDAMAVTGTPAGGAPWIFLSMAEVPPGFVPTLPNGGFVPVMGPTLDGKQFAEMLQRAGTIPRVVPAPQTNNLNPITCMSAAVPTANVPVAQRKGFSTSSLFGTPPPAPNTAKQVLDTIVDPTQSHFFNTDCVSCHTETERDIELGNAKAITGIDPAALPNDPWDVRNFGWGPGPGGTHATVTRRTASETTAVVTYINSVLLSPADGAK